jgi:predicted RNA binding protein YcfA (HicA-like mRNA interferase family)
VKVRDVIRLVEADGWVHVRTTGSHRHYRHPTKPGLVTIPGHPGHDLPPGTLGSIKRQAGLSDERVSGDPGEGAG